MANPQEAKEGVFPHPESSESSTSCLFFGLAGTFFSSRCIKSCDFIRGSQSPETLLLQNLSFASWFVLPHTLAPVWGSPHTYMASSLCIILFSYISFLVIFPHISSGRVFTFVLSSVLQETRIPLVYFPPPPLSLNAVEPGKVRCGS